MVASRLLFKEDGLEGASGPLMSQVTLWQRLMVIVVGMQVRGQPTELCHEYVKRVV